MDPENPRAERKKEGPGVAVLLALAAIATAVIAARASFLSADASTNWQSSVRQQVKQSSAQVEDLRYVYTNEYPTALASLAARLRSSSLATGLNLTSGQTRDMVAIEKSIEDNLATTLAQSNDLATDPAYRTAAGYDVAKRLAAARNENPDLVAINPGEPARQGDDFADRAIRLVGLTVLVGGAFLFGSLAQGFPAHRRLFLIAGSVLLAAGSIGAVVSEAVA